ncbi:MAG: hypothetical protein JXB88_09250 [Spirochaetales bacterium]|nr:hypothetical protein [Spirochaetales bacterium]
MLFPCLFCIDMNSFDFKHYKITDEEIRALQGTATLDSVNTFSTREKIALHYSKSLSSTPITIQSSTIKDLKENFNEREIVIIASTIAQVNYWARLIQGLGIHPEGFSNRCPVLNLDKYKTVSS